MVRISETLRRMVSLGTFFMFRPKATFWATLMLGKRLYCWNTMPMPRSLGLMWVMSLPSMGIWPLVTSSRPERHRSRVLLPQPEGPSRVTRWPFSISMVMPFRTLFCPKSLCMFSKWIYPMFPYSFTCCWRRLVSLLCSSSTSRVMIKVVSMMMTKTALAMVLSCFMVW